ncbi:MAG: hypothetical protein PHD21_05415 [Flavobacteriales bacterium]|nr:hypothetical protein [Flavobacteriales bacterium]
MKKVFTIIVMLASLGCMAQRLDEVSLSSININGMPLYFSVPSEAQDAFGRAIKVETEAVQQGGPYDGIYPYATLDPYGALYGFYPYGGNYFYNDAYPYWGNYAGPWGTTVLYTLIMVYPDMVLYFDQNSTGAPQYLADANIYGGQYSLSFSTGQVSVGMGLSVLEKMFPLSCATALKRHGDKYPSTFKVVVKASQGKGMTQESARIVFVVGAMQKIVAVQVKLN